MSTHLAAGVEGRVGADVGGRPTSCSSTLITLEPRGLYSHGTSRLVHRMYQAQLRTWHKQTQSLAQPCGTGAVIIILWALEMRLLGQGPC